MMRLMTQCNEKAFELEVSTACHDITEILIRACLFTYCSSVTLKQNGGRHLYINGEL